MKPVLKYMSELSPEDHAVFSKSALYARVHEEYLYSERSLNYYQSYHQKFKNFSFLVRDEKEVFLYAAIHPVGDVLSYFEFPVRIFVNDTALQNEALFDALATVKTEIAEISQREGISIMKLYDQPLVMNLFYDKIADTHTEIAGIIDLKLDPVLIKRNIRKSYKSLINWGEKHMQTTVYDATNITDAVFTFFEDFHLKVAGKKTRSHETWLLQREMIKTKEAFLVMSEYNSQIASANLFLTGTSEVFYGVGVSDRELTEVQNLAIAHYPIYKASLYAKEKGFQVFNLNALNKPQATDKEKSISFFKKGFSTQLRSTVVYELNLT